MGLFRGRKRKQKPTGERYTVERTHTQSLDDEDIVTNTVTNVAVWETLYGSDTADANDSNDSTDSSSSDSGSSDSYSGGSDYSGSDAGGGFDSSGF